MSHSRLTHKLRESLALARDASHRHISVDQVVQERAEAKHRFTRREFLGATGAAALALANPRKSYASEPRISVIGAGLAGLRFAHAMWTVHGISTKVYEAKYAPRGAPVEQPRLLLGRPGCRARRRVYFERAYFHAPSRRAV